MEGKYRLETVAYHEAGHAVMALRHGYPVKDIEIRPNGTGYVMLLHRTIFRKWPSHMDAYHRVRLLLDIMNEIRILLAGPIAEAEFCNKPYEMIIRDSVDFDSTLNMVSLEPINRLIKQYTFPELDSIIAQTIEDVIQPEIWRLIDNLAEHLMQNHYIHGDEIINILSSVGASSTQISILSDDFFIH